MVYILGVLFFTDLRCTTNINNPHDLELGTSLRAVILLLLK